jgi:hypothetical protein
MMPTLYTWRKASSSRAVRAACTLRHAIAMPILAVEAWDRARQADFNGTPGCLRVSAQVALERQRIVKDRCQANGPRCRSPLAARTEGQTSNGCERLRRSRFHRRQVGRRFEKAMQPDRSCRHWFPRSCLSPSSDSRRNQTTVTQPPACGLQGQADVERRRCDGC